ncbi:hypothetical protein F5146DRAFT_1007720 [Armillaria mellea]|nr:hypothetical protein F5146DRAFT_1007720 [Armillaria mellea]
MSKQYLKGKTDHDIMDQIEANFHYWKGKISKAKKVHDKKSDESEFSDDDEGSTEQVLCKNRHYARKVWSTDESDQDSVIDPDTDTERSKEIRVPSVRKPWITWQPLYRSTELKDCVETLDAAVQKQCWCLEKENRGKAGPHARRDGELKDTMLPRFKCGRPEHMKISRYTIDEDWLAAHEEQDTPARISQPEEEEEANLEVENIEVGGKTIQLEVETGVDRQELQYDSDNDDDDDDLY